MASLGLGSRRQIERWMQQKRVCINGRLAQLGDRIEFGHLSLDGRLVWSSRASVSVPCRVLLYHKPKGEICSRVDPGGRPTVFEALPPLIRQRWISIGRLDFNTQGLLLFTNNGELAYRLLHPSYEIEREYDVKISGSISKSQFHCLKQGVHLEDGWAAFTRIRRVYQDASLGRDQWYRVTLREGRYREVRRLWASQGISVSSLIRVRFACVQLPPQLLKRHYSELSPSQVKQLAACVKLNCSA